MSVTNTSGVKQNDSIQAQSLLTQTERIKQNTKSSTTIDSYDGTVKSFAISSTKSRNVQKALTDTYRLDETDAKNIQSFVNALSKHIDNQIDKQSVLGTIESWGASWSC